MSGLLAYNCYIPIMNTKSCSKYDNEIQFGGVGILIINLFILGMGSYFFDKFIWKNLTMANIPKINMYLKWLIKFFFLGIIPLCHIWKAMYE